MKKLLSVFLALIMIFGVFAVCAAPVSALSGSGTKSSPYLVTTYSELETCLKKSGTVYIKVAKKLYTENQVATSVVGTKYLDLNGYEIQKFLTTKTSCYMFTVTGNLIINDSSASPKSTDGKGSIVFDNWIWNPSSKSEDYASFIIQRNVFDVKYGGTLTLNQGKIYAGSSEKHWIYDGRAAGNPNKTYNGNAYVQINGSAVTVQNGGKFIMNGGVCEGRGFIFFNISDNTVVRAGAISIREGGSVDVYSGRVQGNGGANVFSTASKCHLGIFGGEFFTRKVDNVWAARAKYKIAGSTAYRNVCTGCGYGILGVAEGTLKTVLKNKSANITLSGKDFIDKSGSSWKLKDIIYAKSNDLRVTPIDRNYANFTTSNGTLFANLNYIYGLKVDLKTNAIPYFPVDSSVCKSQLQINVIDNGKIVKTAYFNDISSFSLKDVYDFTPGTVYTLSGYINQRWNSNDYVIVTTINPITITVKESTVSSAALSYTSSAITDGKIKAGTTINGLGIKSATTGVTASVYQAIDLKSGLGFATSTATASNGKYRITVKLTPSKGFNIASGINVTAFGKTATSYKYAGSTFVNFDLETNCSHVTKKSTNDDKYHYTKCSTCGETITSALHTYTSKTTGDTIRYTCTVCGYYYDASNGKEAVDAIAITSKEAVVGEKIPGMTYFAFPEYWGQRYTFTYQWYKDAYYGANAKQVKVGDTFEDGTTYYIIINGTITNTSKYYFASGAYAASYYYKDIIYKTASDTTMRTVLKVVPTPLGTASINFPSNPVIGGSIFDKVAEIALEAKDKNGNLVSKDYSVWVFEKIGEKTTNYGYNYKAATNSYKISEDAVFTNIKGQKFKANAEYEILISGPTGYSFKNVKVTGGEGVDAEVLDNVIGTKGLGAEVKFTMNPVITDVEIADPQDKAGKPLKGITASANTGKTWYISSTDFYYGCNVNDTVPCDDEISQQFRIKPQTGYTFDKNVTVVVGKAQATIISYSANELVVMYRIAPAGHTIDTTKTVNPTCTKDGSVSGYCSTCKRNVVISTTAKLGHKYATTTTQATATENGLTVKKCSTCGTVASSTTIYKASSVKLSATKYTYNGNAQKPTVTVKNSQGTTLKKDTDYTVKYSSSSSKATGRYTVTITFKGKYTGEKVLTYTIVPKAPTNVKVASSAKNTAKVTYTKATGASGYEIYYCYSKSGTYSKLKTTSDASYTYSKFTSGKYVYVKVRSYKTVNGEKLYGSFSSIVSVKVK